MHPPWLVPQTWLFVYCASFVGGGRGSCLNDVFTLCPNYCLWSVGMIFLRSFLCVWISINDVRHMIIEVLRLARLAWFPFISYLSDCFFWGRNMPADSGWNGGMGRRTESPLLPIISLYFLCHRKARKRQFTTLHRVHPQLLHLELSSKSSAVWDLCPLKAITLPLDVLLIRLITKQWATEHVRAPSSHSSSITWFGENHFPCLSWRACPFPLWL